MAKLKRLFAYVRFVFYKSCRGGAFISLGRNFFGRGTLQMNKISRFEIGEKNVLDAHFDIEVTGILRIGSRNYFNKNVKIVCFEKIEIGDDCLFADSVHIYDHDHRYDDLSKPISQQGYAMAPVKIGNNVWLGAKVTVLKGVAIGEGTIVGANSVVTKDLPAFSVCGGIPAKVIKMRNSLP